MPSFQEKIDYLCQTVGELHPELLYKRGKFFLLGVPNTEVIIDPGFAFQQGFRAIVAPAVVIEHKPSMRIFKRILGRRDATYILRFNAIKNFAGKFRREWFNANIVEDLTEFLRALGEKPKRPESWLDMSRAEEIIDAIVSDGIAISRTYFDLSSEMALLLSLPPKYEPFFEHDQPPGILGSQGVSVSLARMYAKDFGFFDWYRSESCVTVVPKPEDEIEQLYAARNSFFE